MESNTTERKDLVPQEDSYIKETKLETSNRKFNVSLTESNTSFEELKVNVDVKNERYTINCKKDQYPSNDKIENMLTRLSWARVLDLDIINSIAYEGLDIDKAKDMVEEHRNKYELIQFTVSDKNKRYNDTGIMDSGLMIEDPDFNYINIGIVKGNMVMNEPNVELAGALCLKNSKMNIVFDMENRVIELVIHLDSSAQDLSNPDLYGYVFNLETSDIESGGKYKVMRLKSNGFKNFEDMVNVYMPDEFTRAILESF